MALPDGSGSEHSSMDLKDSKNDPDLESFSSSITSWQDIRRAVRSSRKTHAQFANKMPHNFSFIPLVNANNENGSCINNGLRVIFLGVTPGNRDNTLLYIDIPVQEHSPSVLDNPIEWKQVLGCFQACITTEKYSKEEELLRERKRLSVHGITTYQVSSDHSRILFPASGSLFMVNLQDVGRIDLVEPEEIHTQCNGSRMDPKMSPNNPDVVAFIHENDLWVTHTRSQCERRLTYTCKESRGTTLSAGMASYVIQEEFDRYTGYWWQPHNSADKHCILYEVVDESCVGSLHISNPLTDDGVDTFRYPKAGTSNAKVSLKIVEFSTSKDGQICDIVTKKMSEPLNHSIPWMEYLVRVDWLPSGKGIWAQILDRHQQKSAIIYIPLSQFDQVEVDERIVDVEMSDVPNYNSIHNSVKILYEETSDVWINVHDTYYFFQSNPDDEVNFIWASERTGHRHLYLINSHLKRMNRSKRHSTGDLVAGESRHCLSTSTQLTSGHWEVLEQNDSVWVNEEQGQVYFMGLKDTPLESHLYKTSFVTPSATTRLTSIGYSHAVSMSKDCSHFISTSSSINELYTAKIYHLCPQPVAIINMLEATVASSKYNPPELFSFVCSSGDTLHGLYLKPRYFDSSKKYPTVLYVYGGPHVQLVTNSFKGLRYQRLYTLSSLGYVVVAIDGRGSTHRGLQFEGHLKHRMGQVEISDQVEGLLFLASQVEFIDLSRVAIHGWSYGGYLSLMGLAQRPDIFKVAVAGAPVVCWEQYDTAYTERYMGTPQSNVAGYNNGSVISCVPQFPSQPNRLLLVHGLIDENVHFNHTAQLIQALVKNCKPYQLQIYPGERHGIRSPDSNEHFEVAVVSFLQQHL